jgi:uncharacterized protein YjdB
MLWKRSARAVPVLLLLALMSCHGFFTAPVLTSLKVDPTGGIVAAGSTQQFTTIGVNDDGSTGNVSDVTWQSSDETIAKVSTSGVVTGVAKGNAKITAASGSLTGSANILVTTAAVSSINVSSANSVSLVPTGSTLQLTATALLADGGSQDVSSMVNWQSSNTAAATVDSSGKVTGVAAGSTVTITATAGNIQGQISLQVL